MVLVALEGAGGGEGVDASSTRFIGSSPIEKLETMDFRFFGHRKVTPDNLANHLFFPKRLPHAEEENLPEIEQTILEFLNHIAGPILEHVSLPNTNGTISTWMGLQANPVTMTGALAALKKGESACLYVRKQNSSILVRKLDEKYMRVLTFRSSLPNTTITETCGSLKVTYPETMDIVPISSLLLSPCFSNQLACLSSTLCPIAMTLVPKGKLHAEPREPSFPYVVSDFLVGMLCPMNTGDLPQVDELKHLQIQKKLRDQVNLQDSRLPFRRSGLYTSAKVILQLSLNDELMSREDANVMYKIIILEMLTSLAENYTGLSQASWDVTAHMLTKLARRAKKLAEMEETKNANLNLQREATLNRTWSVIDKIHISVSQQWNSTISTAASTLKIFEIHRDNKEWIQDCTHDMSELTAYLNAERIPTTKSEAIDNLNMIYPVVQTRTVNLDDLLQRGNILSNIQQQDIHLNDQSVWLYQVEWFARHNLHSGQPCKQIFELMQLYFEKSFNLYGTTYSDPVYYSRLTITGLKFIAVLDEIAVRVHPLLSQYSTGIQPEMFHDFLIPEKWEMKFVEKLQNYYAERHSKATHENWTQNSSISRRDFCVQFAQGNYAMQKLKEEILDKMDRDIEEKKREVRRVREECENLQERIRRTSCSYTWNSYYEESRHDSNCILCDLEAQLKRKRQSVSLYQRPLPPDDYLRNAVVFELAIPLEIAVLRDGITMLTEDILGYETFSPRVPSENIRTTWTSFCELVSFSKAGHQKMTHLGSEKMDTLNTRHKHEKPDVLYSSVDAFIVENDLNCKYHRTSSLGKKPTNPFTLKIEKAEKKSAENYQSLQFALDAQRTTENGVLAKQYRCHQNIMLKEFIMFGSLRCAHLVQLRNLYASMTTKVLSLEKEPVLQLMMQALWELGPGKREIHVDFELDESKQFSLAFLDQLGIAGEENATNWSNPLVLFALTVVAGRILEMSENGQVKETASKLLKRFRQILEEWCIKLEELLVRTTDMEDAKVLMDLLLKSSICSAFTFNVSSDDIMPYIFKDSSDATFFLKALSRLDHLVVRENILSQNPPSSFIQNLLRHARHAIPLNVHDYLNAILSNPNFNLALHHFVSSKWYEAQTSSSIPTFKHSGNQIPLKKHAYQAEYHSSSHHIACVDILRGTFFVDGYPPSVLPESIIRNPLYTSFFLTNQFRVQRDSSTFKTVDKYRGLHFEFTETGSRLIIRQLSTDGHWFELLPRNLLGDNVAHDFINNFTHWFDSKTNRVYFRRPSSSDTEEIIEDDTDYVMVPISEAPPLSNGWHLQKYSGIHTLSNCHVLSIKSQGFQQITSNLKKLENPNYVHVNVNKNEENISINLWRYNLTFSLNQNYGLLYCENYPGYYLPTTKNNGQNLGTLVGLQSGILLEKDSVSETSGKRKIFLIQHGHLEIVHTEGNQHQSVTVKAESVRNPPYFVYDVDQILKRLRPGNNKSAWLYLAALYGSTSSPFPDPFTQLTGTEMAMWILQCGFPWSCSPYDDECNNILQQISALSPKYQYSPPEHLKLMQSVQWPKGLDKNFYAAYESYAIIVQRLLQDSLRLGGLFPGKKSACPQQEDLHLCKRSYYRNINLYNKAAHLSGEFLEYSENLNSEPLVVALSSRRCYNHNDLVTLAQYRRTGVPSSINETITPFIMTSESLPRNLKDVLSKEFLPSWLEINLREKWLQLYCSAWGSGSKIEHELTMIFGAMLYSGGGSTSQLLNLHNIAVGHNQCSEISFPEPVKSLTESDFLPLNNSYNRSTITEILKKANYLPPVESSYTTYEIFKTNLAEYERCLRLQTISAAEYLETNYWPTDSIDMHSLQRALSGNYLLKSSQSVLQQINGNLINWYNNRNLKLFISEVEGLMTILKNHKSSFLLNENRPLECNFSFQTTPDLVDPWQQQNNDDAFVGDGETKPDAKVMEIFSTGRLTMDPAFTLDQQRNTCLELVETLQMELDRIVLGNCPVNFGLRQAGLHVRLAPVTLLRDHFGKPQNLGRGESCYLGALAVVWAHLKRVNRLMMYDSNPKKFSVELARESEASECENWNPLEHPEWLLLELELDITIRPVQVDVARQMMKMPGEKSGVMQLNMGEGKTSVIIPMVVSTLSNTKDLLSRVTVLNSIFTTNYNLLGFTIGGFVNKRLYTVPCSRDIDMSSLLDTIESIYKECVALGGILITLPEYRLSFRLQMYNCFLQGGKESTGLQIYNIESWLRNHSRDLVDESDEIFSTKYQLIYTTGKQLQMDGGSTRWSVCQKLLEFLPIVAAQLFEKYGTTAIEFQPVSARENPEKFTHFRILSDECKQDLCELIVNGILDGKVNFIGRILSTEERKTVKEFLIDENISEDDHNELFKIDDISTEKRQILLLISGYLRRGILLAALKKRWRVEYGVKKSKGGANSKLMAVPFRAKDVADERSEFGHPDMAIVLTQLSYYYSGLSDDQLYQCFRILETATTGPETVYNSWIKKIPSGKITSETVKSYKGINLADYEQRTGHLFPLLRNHKAVIDFWLENAVFPKECKQFPGKLVTNAWDLCYDRNVHPTTGFSGTNDTSLLLPNQITQQDLDVLKETNTQMELTLRQDENRWERSMEMGVECKELLQFMIQDGLRVLIDAGALMLQLGNEKIAELWLELDKSLDAVVYFSNNGELVTKVRRHIGYKKRSKGERDQLLTLSQFKDGLENCAIYLDDQHTRGTDIKLPTNFKACVTVGSGMRRDKLIQACMRMRKLGKGQSVHFYLSHEVDNKIKQQQANPQDKITVEDIIKWVKENSYHFEKDGLLYWAVNAKNYAKNLAADDLFELSEKLSTDTALLAERCQDSDAQKLQVMYGTYHHRIKIMSMIPVWFSRIRDKLNTDTCSTEYTDNLPEHISDTLDAIEFAAVSKCRKHIPRRILFHSMLEEEQEKELEPEQEVEEQRHRPPEETPLVPQLHENVRKCVTLMNFVNQMDGISGLSSVFGATTIKTMLQNDSWGAQCFVTEDFINVIKSNSAKTGNDMDCFIRAMRFFVSFKNASTTTILLLSLYEVNCLIKYLRERKCSPETTLHMFSGRWMEGQPIFAREERLQLPVRIGFEGATLNEDVLAPLLIAAGNLYFESMEEQRAFAKFLGFRFRPWSEQEETAFKARQITSSGFVVPSCPELREGCEFQKNPTDMVIGILKLRNDVLRDADHTISILQQCAYLP